MLGPEFKGTQRVYLHVRCRRTNLRHQVSSEEEDPGIRNSLATQDLWHRHQMAFRDRCPSVRGSRPEYCRSRSGRAVVGLNVEEVNDSPGEERRVLEVSAVVSVWKQPQLGVWEMLVEAVRVDGWNDDVVVAVDYERGLDDAVEVVETAAYACTPLARSCSIGGNR